MLSNAGRRALLALLVTGCHAGTDADAPGELVRVTPSEVGKSEQWALFDRSISSTFTPNGENVQATLDRVEQLSALKVYGASPYKVHVTGENGASLGFGTIDLSKLKAGWNVVPASSLISTKVVELRFEATRCQCLDSRSGAVGARRGAPCSR